MRRCEDEKMFYRPPLLEEPCAQTLAGTIWNMENDGNFTSLQKITIIGKTSGQKNGDQLRLQPQHLWPPCDRCAHRSRNSWWQQSPANRPPGAAQRRPTSGDPLEAHGRWKAQAKWDIFIYG